MTIKCPLNSDFWLMTEAKKPHTHTAHKISFIKCKLNCDTLVPVGMTNSYQYC